MIQRMIVVAICCFAGGCSHNGSPPVFKSPSPGAAVPDAADRQEARQQGDSRTGPGGDEERPAAGASKAGAATAAGEGTRVGTEAGETGVDLAEDRSTAPEASSLDGSELERHSGLGEPPDAGAHPSRMGLVFASDGVETAFSETYSAVNGLMQGGCPQHVKVECLPWTGERVEGPVWADWVSQKIYVMALEPSTCAPESRKPELAAALFRVCLGHMTSSAIGSLSRDEKGLRFLEDGFARYVEALAETEDGVSANRSRANFMDFVAKREVEGGFSFADFWRRLPTWIELKNPDYALLPGRIEASLVAGAFVLDLVERQGWGVEGYLALWRALTTADLARGPEGGVVTEENLSTLLNDMLSRAGEPIPEQDIGAFWSDFVAHVQERTFDRPRTTVHLVSDGILVAFDREMARDWVDLTLDNIQFGSERLSQGLGGWTDSRHLAMDLVAAREQLGIEVFSTVSINRGKVWQWFRSVDGVPAESISQSIEPPQPADLPE